VHWEGRTILTGIFKHPTVGPVNVGRLGIEGDVQADLRVHGGPEKAVYAYPAEHYEYWANELQRVALPWGMFGENLTTEGLLENEVHLGDEFRIGSAGLRVTRPRFPCQKLGMKFGDMRMVKRFQDSGRSGFYLSVVQEGRVSVGDPIELIDRVATNPTVADTFTALEE
jgi:MOSC domain-containing protein YiiM